MSLPEVLVDYLAGALPPEAADAFEADLMAGRYDGDDLQWLGAVVLALRAAAISGTLTIGISEAELAPCKRPASSSAFKSWRRAAPPTSTSAPTSTCW